MLAYLFWHRPRDDVAASAYEAALADFHRRLGIASRCERVAGVPWLDGGAGYLDWYFVAGWAALGEINSRAVTGQAEAPHARVAALSGAGAGGVMELAQGDVSFRPVWQWLAKPAGMGYAEFYAGIPHGAALWRRQMVLGPTAEFALAGELVAWRVAQTEHSLVWGQPTA